VIVARASDGTQCTQLRDVAEIAKALERPEVTLWIDADSHDEQVATFLRDTLRVHQLVIEDIFEERANPKVEDHGNYLYVVLHGVRRDAQSPQSLGTVELDILIGKNFVFTHHSLPMRSLEELANDLDRNPRLLNRGPAFTAHAIVDRLTDHYLPVVDAFEEEIDEIEEQVVNRPRPKLLPRLFALKRSLQRLRRISVHQRDVLQRLSRPEFGLIPPEAMPFFRDAYDHFVRIADLADSYRELVMMALEMYMSGVANRTNEIMKALALISTIMLPLNFMTGIYGMNFDNLPGKTWYWGFWALLTLMGVVSLVLFLTFRRRRWF
jgi:magnesium transporter